jgi:serine phosphatase RsbU (regulator of sigma subunit)
MDLHTDELRPLDREALVRHGRVVNGGLLRSVAIAAALLAAAVAIYFYAIGKTPETLAALANLGLLGVLATVASTESSAPFLRQLTVAFLLSQAALFVWLLGDQPAWLRLAVLLGLAVLSLLFHLGSLDRGLLLLALGAGAVWLWSTGFGPLGRAPQGLGGVLWPGVLFGGLWLAGSALVKERRRTFLEDFRREASLDRERDRMREEIESARQIQLSMLPRTTPRLEWLDLASVSMPASEVGGDYYDFFPLPEEKLGLVIADVAGHGLPSSLLLSSLRSCLYLLRQDLGAPQGVLAKLDDMVRHTTGRRMLVTLQSGCFCGRERRLVLANAGHPSPLRFVASTGEVEEIATPALPLGTRLGATYQETETALASGDVLLFFTDGLIETPDGRGEGYGSARLCRVFAEAARKGTALDIRNALLGDLADYKGDARREDDVTLVVARVR